MNSMNTASIYLLAVFIVITTRTQATLVVPSTANIYGADHSGAAATPSPGGSSPGPGPAGGTAPPFCPVIGGDTITFSITGLISFGGGTGTHGPDGYASGNFDFGSFNGIAGFRNHRGSALYGVFTGPVEPADPSPVRLDFVGKTSSSAFAPELDQIFFIGDGLTGLGTGTVQRFHVPIGATAVYFGLADGYPVGQGGFHLPGGYNDNTGSFQVEVDPVTLIAHYHFDESTGPTAYDSTGAFNGTLSVAGAAFTAGGISGNAISLDRAAGGFVNMGTSFPGFLNGDYSIVFWMKTTTTEIDTIAVSKHTANSANGFYFNINPTGDGGVPSKVTFDASSQTSQGATSASSVNDGVWHQIVGVYQAGGNEFIYVDGAPAEATSPTTAMISNTAPFMIGGISSDGTPTARYTGLIDEVQVYDRALTAEEITYLFHNPSKTIQTLGPLTLERDGPGFRLTWPGNGILQSNDTLSGTWNDVNAGTATSPFLIPNPGERDFFRLRN